MSGLQGITRAPEQSRIILVVSAHKLSWYRFDQTRITDRFSHSVNEEPLTVIDSCIWLKFHFDNSAASLELVVDTELDDLDRVKLIGSSHWISRPWHIWKVLWQLRREYPHAMVSSLPGFLYPEIASVLYSQLSESSLGWLQKLSDNGIVVSHAVTSTQLLLDVFRDCSSPVLLHKYDGNRRHRLLLAVDGVPLYMRQTTDTTVFEDSFSGKAGKGSEVGCFARHYLSESLDYLSTSVFSSLENILVVFPADLNSEELPEFHDEYLAKYMLGLQCECHYQKISFNHVQVQDSQSPYIDSLARGYVSDILKDKVSERAHKLENFRRRVSSKQRYTVTRKSLTFGSVLKRSINSVRDRRRARYLKNISVVVCLLLLIYVYLYASSGFRSTKDKAKYEEEYARVEKALEMHEQLARALHPSPSFVLDSIRRIQQFEEAGIPLPAQIMRGVSDAVTRSPFLYLTGFSWVVVDKDYELSHVTVDSLPVRKRHWAEGELATNTEVEVSGQIVGENNLRQQQRRFSHFLSLISKDENINNLLVLDSPAKAAKSNRTLSESEGVFKIRFSLTPI